MKPAASGESSSVAMGDGTSDSASATLPLRTTVARKRVV